MNHLTKEEQALSQSFDRGEWTPVKNMKAEIKQYASYAKASLKKTSRVNLRISPQDLNGIQQKAIEEGIPYQTLMASIIHKYVVGKYVEERTPAPKF